MAEDANQSGGRRGILAAAATGLLAALGAIFIVLGSLGGSSGPPEPPDSMSLHQPTAPRQQPSSQSPSDDTAQRPDKRPSTDKPATADNHVNTTRALGRSRPVALRIPAIDAQTTQFVPLGLQPNGKIEVPKENHTVGWYKNGPTPGQFGPAVMGGHVDSDAGPAIFYHIGDLRPGDTAIVRRADGTTAVFTVYAVEQYPKNDFPTQKVYAPTNNRAELRLITCGGTFNDDTQHYRSNIIAYAKLTSLR